MNILINKKSLADEVAHRLNEQISLGQYQVNEKLPIEPELMKTFGVGRSTIREAIKILINSGFLRVQQGVGTFVESVTGTREPLDQRLKRASIADLDEIRQLLEVKIAEKAAANRTDEDIQAIKKELDKRKLSAKKGLLEDCIDADIRFHVAIAHASKNEILADLYQSATVHLKKWFLHTHMDTRRFTETYALHEQLFKHIVAADADKARQTASKIIAN